MKHSVCIVVIAISLSANLSQPAQAELPRVEFDVAAMVGCRDVTPADFAAVNPDERLVEAVLEVSSLLRGSDDNELVEFFYEFTGVRDNCQIVDYLPRTTLASELAGNIGVEKKHEKVRSLGIGISGLFEYVAKVNASADIGSKRNSQVKYELLPPLETVSASGTIHRRRGVYFKLKPSRQTSLEGSKQFVFVLRVPHSWRGDLLHVNCRAVGQRSNLLKDSRISQISDFSIALYLDGDTAAKSVAAEYVLAEKRLRRLAAANHDTIKSRRWPTLMHKLGGSVSAVDPTIPENWLRQVTCESGMTKSHKFEQHLPKQLQTALAKYRAAATNLMAPL